MLLLLAAALAAEPSDAEALVTRARAALAAGDMAEAEQLLIELFQFFPDSEAAQRVAKAGLGGVTPSTDDEAAASALMRDVQAATSAGDFATAKQRIDDLVRRFPDTKAGKSSLKLRSELALIGAPAPRLVVERWYQGTAAFGSNGATLVVFWEAWCPHCNNEAEHIERIATTLAGRLDVVGLTKVTRSSTDERVAGFIQEHGWTFPVAKEQDGSMSTAFSVTGIPAAAIVKDGVIVWRGHPAKLTDSVLEQVLE